MKSPRSESPALETLKLVCRALDEKKAEDLRVLDVSEQSSLTDYLVVATGTSEPHLRALRIELEKVLDAAKIRIVGIDTNQASGWLVVDAFDVMVHLFTGPMREHYQLERLWKDAVEVSVPRLLEEPRKPAKKPAARKPAAKKPAAGKSVRKPAAKKPAARRTKS
ncbi:ribosomal silencing factor RsfS [mine drainage metagenome]|uniref:Ribosomal silencing factor RsfS n=1 Tax=mine drainage metagenome TaxID=410659 RepID=A0A1J5S6H9_9ZZZZ